MRALCTASILLALIAGAAANTATVNYGGGRSWQNYGGGRSWQNYGGGQIWHNSGWGRKLMNALWFPIGDTPFGDRNSWQTNPGNIWQQPGGPGNIWQQPGWPGGRKMLGTEEAEAHRIWQNNYGGWGGRSWMNGPGSFWWRR